ncbi:uncharacterized protein TRAVEDRAFT_45570 [Trametes versicolor FP-101664 SS1]|uniref:uncharacterized protein n=1 Tax=Trametes versicolor (strain FP-101664) TaxID=717944 RepID=UPI0004621318|nr:uncharacterized protein TRAVEDRAFT_45570 [Trametes versicolor FP-101664 SS1]EIW60320.1 hypothetical protein TRAVEDRAFT_45570 [Trametes versicolor FP-101664 SS1]
MQSSQTYTFHFSEPPVASGSDNDWAARPTQAINQPAVPELWPLGPATQGTSLPTAANCHDFLKTDQAEPARNLVSPADGQMIYLDDLAFLNVPHTPAAAAASPIPSVAPVLKLCGRCLNGYTQEDDGSEVCAVSHAPPVDAWIAGDNAIYPVHWYPCCGRYRLAIPGLRLKRPFNAVCRWAPHIPAN